MKRKFKKRMLSLVAVIAIGLSCQIAQAQGPFPELGGGDDDVDDGPGTSMPIDGFIGVAIAAGAYFGSKKLRANKEEE